MPRLIPEKEEKVPERESKAEIEARKRRKGAGEGIKGRD